MPQLYRLNGVKICMYSDDHNPPHVHAEYSGEEYLYYVDGGFENRLPSRKHKEVSEWINVQRTYLFRKWEELNS